MIQRGVFASIFVVKLRVTMNAKFFLLALGMFTLPLVAAPLTSGTFTEIIHEVNTLSPSGQATPAKVSDFLIAPARVRTGAHARAELTAPDDTITRIGADTTFSFADSGRTLKLEKGSLLFHSPKGKGGGVIKTGGAVAAVLGTTGSSPSAEIFDGYWTRPAAMNFTGKLSRAGRFGGIFY